VPSAGNVFVIPNGVREVPGAPGTECVPGSWVPAFALCSGRSLDRRRFRYSSRSRKVIQRSGTKPPTQNCRAEPAPSAGEEPALSFVGVEHRSTPSRQGVRYTVIPTGGPRCFRAGVEGSRQDCRVIFANSMNRSPESDCESNSTTVKLPKWSYNLLRFPTNTTILRRVGASSTT